MNMSMYYTLCDMLSDLMGEINTLFKLICNLFIIHVLTSIFIYVAWSWHDAMATINPLPQVLLHFGEDHPVHKELISDGMEVEGPISSQNLKFQI